MDNSDESLPESNTKIMKDRNIKKYIIGMEGIDKY